MPHVVGDVVIVFLPVQVDRWASLIIAMAAESGGMSEM